MKSFGRAVVAASAAVAFTAGTAFVAPVVGAAPSLGSVDFGSLGSGSQSGDNCGEQIVTSVNAEGSDWATPSDETPAKIEGLATPSETLGAAVLAFPDEDEKGEDDKVLRGASLYKTVDIPLKDILDEGKPITLGYEYTASGQAPALQIRLNGATVDTTTDKTGFTTIYWAPAASEASDGSWKNATAGADDSFYVTRNILGGGADGDEVVINQHTATPLQEIVEANPEAKIVAYGVQRTQNTDAKNVAIDNFTFGCETTNFELPAEDDLVGSVTGSLGGDTGSLAIGGLLTLGVGAAAVAFAAQNGLIQIPGL